MRSFPVFAFWLGCLLTFAATPLRAAFGLSTSSSQYTVDTGAGLVFKVDRANGGIPSIVLNGTELNIGTPSGIASGLGSTGTNVSASATASLIVITVATDATNGVVAGMTHYYVVQSGVNTIHMATYVTNEPGVGELRWITRLQSGLFTRFIDNSNLTGNTGAIESSDVFGFADGTTRSKYFGNQHAKDLSIRGITGAGRGVFMAYGTRESASGGPFYHDIQNQTAEVYNYMNSGHNQTEANRLGVLHGPYALVFTDGSTPSVPDMGFLSALGLAGYIDASGRGAVAIAGITGRDTGYDYTVGFANETAQHWADADAFTGATTCAGMKPGAYTMTIYKGQLGVYSASVNVTAGATTSLSVIALTADPSRTVPLWRIGNWDGTPLEFINGPNINLMHPSDVRQSSWVPGPYTVGASSPATGFPSCQWKDVNGTQAVGFTLTASQVAAYTVRIGITAAYAGGRPNIGVNSWTNTSLPSASSQPDSRSLTVGTYRGNNRTYTFNAPASAFVAGANTLYISAISGSSGTTYLSPGYAIDCVDIYPSSGSALLDVPAAPNGLVAQGSANPRTVALTWTAVSGAAFYEVRRATSADGPYTTVASNLTGPAWSDTDVADAVTYRYLVTASNTAGTGVPASASIDIDGPGRAPATLTWSGTLSSTWDTSTLNWTYPGGSTFFYYPADAVRFDDTGSATAVSLSGALSPASVTVDSSKSYAFTGGTLSGPGGLEKSGSGTLTLSTAHTYTGGTTLSGGTLALAAGGSVTGTLTLSDGATFRLASSGANFSSNPLTLVSATAATLSSASLGNTHSGAISGPAGAALTLSGPVSLNATGTAQFGAFLGTVTIPSGSQLRFSSTSGPNGNGGTSTTFVVNGLLNTRNAGGAGGVVLGALSGSGSIQGQTNTTAGSVTFNVGAKGLDTTFSGTIANGANGTAALNKIGAGSLTLSGASTYTGATTISAGALYVAGSLGATAVSVSPGATIGGTGTLAGNLTLASGSRLALGFGFSSTKGLAVSGASTLNGAITVVPAFLGGSLAPGTYTLLAYTGTLSGSPAFSWLDTTGSGYTATFDTSVAGVVKITLVAPLTALENWRVSHFGSGAAGGSGSSANDADPDGDGFPNLLEYALGSDPVVFSSAAYQIQLAGSVLSLNFTRIADPSLAYTVQGSSDLSAWTDLWTSSGAANLAGLVTVSDPVALSSSARRFLRLRVILP